MSEASVEAPLTCPLCQQSEHVRRLLFYTYCANPAHTHAKGGTPTNTVLEFRYCIVHGRPDDCVAVAVSSGLRPPAGADGAQTA